MAEGILWKPEEFFQRMQRLSSAYPTAAEQAAGQVATQVLNDCVMEPPTVPIDTGNLRSTGNFEVMRVGMAAVRIYVGYNTPYATKVHEIPMNFREPSAGNKYLEAKLVRHKADYIRVWGQKLARLLGMEDGGALPMAAGGGSGGSGAA